MKTSLKFCTVAAVVGLASGCAALPPAATSTITVVDEARVDMIERVARQNGTRVTWINKPTRQVERT